MKWDDWIGPLSILIFVIVCIWFGAWLARPRTVVVEGIQCVQSGWGNSAAISCDWQHYKENEK